MNLHLVRICKSPPTLGLLSAESLKIIKMTENEQKTLRIKQRNMIQIQNSEN